MYAHLCLRVCVYTYILEYNSNDKKHKMTKIETNFKSKSKT